jgi:FkbM family methyltransferase
VLDRLLPAPKRAYVPWCRERFGTLAAVRGIATLIVKNASVAKVPVPTGGRLWIRPGTADQRVFDEIFVERSYAVDITGAEYIVDAGAHIGCATVFFKHLCPRARIIAIEPDRENFELLTRNLRDLPATTPSHSALWSRSARVSIQNPHKATWSYRVAESDHGDSVVAYSVADIMDRFNLPRIDVLKMDIEGAEVEVLADAHRWLHHVGMLIIETHDRWRDGCTSALATATAGEPFASVTECDGRVAVFRRKRSP